LRFFNFNQGMKKESWRIHFESDEGDIGVFSGTEGIYGTIFFFLEITILPFILRPSKFYCNVWKPLQYLRDWRLTR
jgi:hypothetical protein